MGKSCRELRADARAALKGKYWYAFGVCLLILVIAFIMIGIQRLIAGPVVVDSSGIPQTGVMNSVASLVSVLLTVFVSFPLGVGMCRFFIVSRNEKAGVGELAYPFKNSYVSTVGAMVKQMIFIYLWSMLFIIPGIIKSFSYFMVQYIMAENPALGSKRAFEISKKAMKGYKGKTFLLGLSFIGWILLALITVIGIFFLEPYMQAAYAEIYAEIKESAFERGIISEGELPR